MNHRNHKDGTPITDADAGATADEAEQGSDVDTLLRRRRRGGRPPLGSAAASVESVRLDPELKRALLVRAAQEHVSVSEVIRRAIGEYLQAS
jgi:predicted HicB family RNase H-like nuclease